MAEEVPASELLYVVPFEARSRYVGADCLQQLAHVRGGPTSPSSPRSTTSPPAVRRAPLQALHRARMAAMDEARPRGLPRLVAQPLGQAAIPSNVERKPSEAWSARSTRWTSATRRRSRSARRAPTPPLAGHHLGSVDSERDALTVLKLVRFHEQLAVCVADGELRAEHDFYLARRRFLTLHYEIERIASSPAGAAGL